MGICVPTAKLKAIKDEKYLSDEMKEQPVQPTTESVYKLNDFRSLEGVARLWSEKLKTPYLPNGEPVVQTTNSVPVIGNNHTMKPFSPIVISTYYFIHSPSAKNQPNLLQSHSSPHNLPQKQPITCTTNQLQTRSTLQLPQTPIDENKEIVIDLDSAPQINYSNRSSIITLSYSAPQGLPPLEMMPVFSCSNSTNSTVEYYTPITHLADSSLTGLHLNIDGKKHDPTLVNVPMTYSDKNVFSLNNNMDIMGLNTNDFMEYEVNTNALNLGVGASGIVKKAFHFSSCKMVAIKQCRSKFFEEVAAFEKEAKLYALFKNNKYIVDIIGFGNNNNNESLMALEYMDLGSVKSLHLTETIKDIKKRELIVGYIVYNVLLALVDFHQRLYVHNDVKAGNILANKYGEIKLSDFGTSLQLENEKAFLKKNNGTQRFQSPEKMLMKIKYNQKSDIWSLGITCYELLFGAEEQENQIKYTTKPPHLDPKQHNLSANCCNFINKCLTVDQYDRPSSNELLSHDWLTQNIEQTVLKDKWAWLITDEDLSRHNEDLLFMISALIIYYSTKTFNDEDNGSIHGLHRRVSLQSENKNGGKVYSDERRIENMAKYGLCSKDIVMDRIKVTVSYIKSQLNKMEMSM